MPRAWTPAEEARHRAALLTVARVIAQALARELSQELG